MADPRRLYDAKDMEGAILYVKRITSAEDAWPLLANEDGSLIVSITGGSLGGVTVSSISMTCSATLTDTVVTVHISPSASKVTVEASAAVFTSTLRTVELSPTVVTAHLSPSASVVTVHISPSASKVTVEASAAVFTSTLRTVALSPTTVTVHISPSASKVTVEASAAVFTSTLRTVSLSPTVVTAHIIAGQSGILGGVGATGANVPRIVIANDQGRTLTTATGSLNATNGTLTNTPSNRAKVYAISLTTTSTTSVICVFNSGGVANGVELWRVLLQAPSGGNSGVNLAITPPGFLFQSRSGTAISLSLSTAVVVHYSLSYYDEA